MGHIPLIPEKREGALFRCPWVWCGNVAVDGTTGDWLAAPLGSQYTRITGGSVSLRYKATANGNSGDWLTVTAS